jgi:heterodisulfide reductase subunit B
MAYGLFLGCVVPNRYPGIESATRETLSALGVEFTDLEGASCCPAPGVVRSFDKVTWLAIGARNLVIAERKGVDILTICNGCYGSLFDIAHALAEDEKLREEVNNTLREVDMEYKGTVKVRHFAEVLYKEVGIEKIKSRVKTAQALKAAVHYGCHFLKPSKLKHLDNPERPKILDELVEAAGATSVNYRDKNMCCGAGGGVRARVPEVALKITQEKLDNIKAAKAEYIVNVCPFCHLQYDRGQQDLGGSENGYSIPVLHLTQLYALAFGVDKSRLGLDMHATPVKL